MHRGRATDGPTAPCSERDGRDPQSRARARGRAAAIDTSTIALWLGQEQERTTHVYLHADLALKQRTLDRITPPNGHPGRYRAPDTLLAFLEGL
jgi:hypothetical protein